MIDKVEIAMRHGLKPEIGSLLHGTTRDELVADAACRSSIARLVGGKLNPPPSAQPLTDISTDELRAELQRRESTDVTESGEIGAEPVTVEKPDADEPVVDFDGGARETAPMPADPYRTHDEFVLDLLLSRGTSAAEFWSDE